MNILRSILRLFRNRSYRNISKQISLGRNVVECNVKLLDSTVIKLYVEKTALSCELNNQVFLNMDLVERDFFGLSYNDKFGNVYWIDPLKSLHHHLKQMQRPYIFEFKVKFYAIDPDQLNEELTRYHFFLQLRSDINQGKLVLSDDMMVEIIALSIQSEIGDFEDGVSTEDCIKEAVPQNIANEDLIKRIEVRHIQLAGLNPGQCEIEFLKRIKQHEFYGIQRYCVKCDDNDVVNLGFSPSGIVIIRDEQKIGFYSWNRVNIIGFKNKAVKMLIHNRMDPNIIDRYTFYCSSVKVAKSIWKAAIESHSFFRLVKNPRSQVVSKMSRVFSSNFRYSGRTFYEATENSARASRRRMSFKRSKTMTVPQRNTAGYIRLGSKVYCRAENGEYFRGEVVALSDKVYVKCDDGITLAHQKNTSDGIIYDSNPDEMEIKIGTRVIAHWPGISNYLPGNISSVEGRGDNIKYLVSFDDGDSHWNPIDRIRLLKPPMYFGPGSNSTYLQKKFSMIKTTTLVNSKLACTSKMNETFTKTDDNDDISIVLIPTTKSRIIKNDINENLISDTISLQNFKLTKHSDENVFACKDKMLVSSKI